MKLIYTTPIHYSHRIVNEPDLVDQSCMINHNHDNAVIVVKLQVIEGKFLDFKHIQDVASRILEKYEGQNITDKYEIGTAEQFITVLSDDFKKAFNRSVEITLWETEKYGIEIASC